MIGMNNKKIDIKIRIVIVYKNKYENLFPAFNILFDNSFIG